MWTVSLTQVREALSVDLCPLFPACVFKLLSDGLHIHEYSGFLCFVTGWHVMWVSFVPLRRLSMSLLSDASSCGMLEGNYGRACGVLWAGLLSPCVLVVMVVPAGARGSFCRTRTNYSANAGHPIDTHSFNTTTHTHTHLLYLPASKTSLLRHAHKHIYRH